MQRRRRHPVLRALAATVLLLAVLAAAAGAATLWLFDAPAVAPRIEAAVVRASGGRLVLRGAIRLNVGVPPQLVADDVAFRAADGSVELTAARVAARVALLPLLTGTVEVARLDLVRPVLTLRPASPSPAQAQAPAPPQAPAVPVAARPAGQVRFVIGAVRVRDGEVRWRGTTFAVPRLAAAAPSPGAPLLLSGEVVSAGRRLMLSGETGPAERLFDPAAVTPWRVQAVLEGSAVRLAVRGGMTSPLRLRGYGVQVDLAATDLTAFAPFLPVPPPALHDAALSARLTDGGAAWPEVSGLALHVAGLDLGAVLPGLMIARADVAAPDLRQPAQVDVTATLRGTALHLLGRVGPQGATLPVSVAAEATVLGQVRAAIDVAWAPRPAVRGTVAATRLDLDALLAALTPAPAAPSPNPGAPAASPAPAAVFPDRPIDLAPLRDADADLHLSVAALLSGGLTYTDVAGHLVLAGGRLVLAPFAGDSPGGRLEGRVSVDAGQAVPPVALRLRAPALALAPFAEALGQPGAVDGTAALDADLTAAGASPHALAASLGGHLTLTAGDAAIDDALLADALRGVLRAARLPEKLAGGKAGELGRTQIRCLDLRLQAAEGIVTVEGLALDTARLAVQGGGTADLGAETLNLHLRPLLRVGPGLVLPVRLGGTLRDPKAALDAGAAGQRPLPPTTCAAPADGAAGAPEGEAKPPKPVDILRGLLTH
jgi:uncharacterized protein involved in outer membrane biogenesis